MFKTLYTGLQDLLFPHNCLLCRTYITDPTTKIICSSCHHSLKINQPPFCTLCSRSLTKKDGLSGQCRHCTHHKPEFDVAYGAYQYNEPMKKLIHYFKYYGKTSIRLLAADYIKHFCHTYYININRFDLIIPMPLHPTRYRERGFNQSTLIAMSLSQHVEKDTLLRVKNTHYQSHLGQKDRWTNITGAFKMNPLLTVENKSILLIDDLLTTGATASEAAKTLKKAGAVHVGILTLAIA